MDSTGALSRLCDVPVHQGGIQSYRFGLAGQMASASSVSSILESLLRAEVVVDNGARDKFKLEPLSLASLTCSSRSRAIAAFIMSKLQIKSLCQRKAQGTF